MRNSDRGIKCLPFPLEEPFSFLEGSWVLGFERNLTGRWALYR